MPAPVVEDIRIADIEIGPGRRPIDEAWVDVLAESIRESQLWQPIVICPDPRGESPYLLLIGAHRLRAVWKLGRETIPAVVRDKHELQDDLAELDENLVRNGLDKLERGLALLKRQKTYLALHPEAMRGGDHGNQYTGGKAQSLRDAAFALDAAERTGLSRRSVELAIQIARSLWPETIELIRTTWVADNQQLLFQLGRFEPDRQEAIARLLTREPDPVRTVADAEAILDGTDRVEADQREKQVRALATRWERAGEKVRSDFLHHLVTNDRDRLAAALRAHGWELHLGEGTF